MYPYAQFKTRMTRFYEAVYRECVEFRVLGACKKSFWDAVNFNSFRQHVALRWCRFRILLYHTVQAALPARCCVEYPLEFTWLKHQNARPRISQKTGVLKICRQICRQNTCGEQKRRRRQEGRPGRKKTGGPAGARNAIVCWSPMQC